MRLALGLWWLSCGWMLAWGGDFSPQEYSQFEKHEWQSPEGGVLLYRFYKPEIKEGEKYPLIIFLHGAGERGNNNESQFVQDHFLNLIFSEEAKSHPAFCLVPQCPTGERWCEVDWGMAESHHTPEIPSSPMRKLHELLQWLKKEYPVDTQRIYVTGISMGGFGTFDFLVRYPEEVAAAVPVCGGADCRKLAATPALRSIPIWIFHGGADSVVKPIRSRMAYETLKPINPRVRYTEFPDVDHFSWVQAYHTRELVDWLFQQVKH